MELKANKETEECIHEWRKKYHMTNPPKYIGMVCVKCKSVI